MKITDCFLFEAIEAGAGGSPAAGPFNGRSRDRPAGPPGILKWSVLGQGRWSETGGGKLGGPQGLAL